jgi:Mrp family chromosome partitioning ATPase
LIDVLISAASLDDALVSVPVSAQTPGSGSERSLDILLAGVSAPPNPAELIESQAMSHLIAEASKRYDLVVLDSAPLTAVSDTVALLPHADGVIVVSRVGRSRRDVAKRMTLTLKRADAPVLGVVANGVPKTRSGGYGYGYGYYQRAGSAPRADSGLETQNDTSASEVNV